MYQIIIADDEEDVREILARNINQSGKEFQVIGTAENGVDALRLVKELNPSIVITDICMPVLGGLELIKSIQDFDPSIKTVVISGHDEFSYAKKAMALGVTEYLLKPFLPEELFEVLYKIKDNLDHQIALTKNITKMQNQIEKNLIYSQERFLKKVIEGSYQESEIILEGENVQIDLTAKVYCTGIFKVSVNTGHHAKELNGDRVIADFFSIIKEQYFDPEIKIYAISFEENQIVLIFCGACRNHLLFFKHIEQGIEKINESMERYYHTKVNGVLGNAYESIEKISISYQEALSAWKRVLDFKVNIVRYDEGKKRNDTEEIGIRQKPKELELSLLLHIQMNRREKALEALQEIFVSYASYGIEYMEFVNVSLVELVFRISESLAKAGGNLGVWEDDKVIHYLKRHFTYGSLMEAKSVLEDYIIRCCEEFSIINEKQSEKIVYNVKMLIENNLSNEEFNIEEASAQLFFSHNYVRQVFKQKTGESFNDYLFRRRMEVALELLKNPSQKIREIALSIGYSNQRYFASCFKKYYNCTPTEYREKLGNKTCVSSSV